MDRERRCRDRRLVYTGNQVTVGQVSGPPGSGQGGSVGWVHGVRGGVAPVDDDLYAGQDSFGL